MFVNSCIRAVKYRFKLLCMNENRFPKQAYHMQINMELNGKCCWASGLRDWLCKFGFGLVWLQKSVGNEMAFWQFSRNDSVMILTKSGLPLLTSVRDFCVYASFKSNLLTENYLDFVRIKCFRDVLIKLRMGVLPLNANRFRYAHENASKILCSSCEIEDEVDFICFCALNKELRQKFMHRYLQTEHSFTLLMQCHEKSSSQNLAFFVFHACKKRDIYVLLK